MERARAFGLAFLLFGCGAERSPGGDGGTPAAGATDGAGPSGTDGTVANPAVDLASPAVDLANPAVDLATTSNPAVDGAIKRAQSGVGFSYQWGGGCWDPADTGNPGTCTGSCPSCTHTGPWGADCSGYVSKIWQIPSAEPMTTCDHPYTTSTFYNSYDYWADVPRSSSARGDAYVHNNGSSGHIFIFESGDPWNWIMAYEAKGCSTGISHDMRTAGSEYKVIRRTGY